jgi:GT2 family glycosyltransferase
VNFRKLRSVFKTRSNQSDLGVSYISDGSLGAHLQRIDNFDIAPNGSNVGIAILDYGRLQDTLRFLKSIPLSFKGNIYLFSQGNPTGYTEKLQEFVSEMRNTHLVINSTNLGVAKARNALFEIIDSPWILSLDNDFTFESNPFDSFAEIQALSGAHFINVGFFDLAERRQSFGGHVEVKENSNNQPRMIIRGASKSERESLGSFYFNDLIFGGASMLNRDTFRLLGGFDSEFQVGFEDVDFSIRVFRAGYKVASLNRVFFNHGSAVVSNQRYKEVRFNKKNISSSALLLAKKYKFVTWEKEDDDWLENKLGKNQDS